MLNVNLIFSIFLGVDIYFVEISDSGRKISPLTAWSKGMKLVRENGKFNVMDV